MAALRKIIMCGLGTGETCDWCQRFLGSSCAEGKKSRWYHSGPSRYFCSEECKIRWRNMKYNTNTPIPTPENHTPA